MQPLKRVFIETVGRNEKNPADTRLSQRVQWGGGNGHRMINTLGSQLCEKQPGWGWGEDWKEKIP